MAEYIDRDAFIAHIRKDPLFGMVEQYGITGVIKAFPASDVQPVKHGKWVFHKPPDDWIDMLLISKSFYVCDICGNIEDREETYCSKCGAKMDGGDVK